MAIPHVLVLAAALVALLCLPCAVAVLICSDDLSVRRAWSRRGRAVLVALHCLDRELRGSRAAADPTGTLPFEQVAADLRRLDHQRHTGPTTSSERWAEAVLLAYDERLKLACRYLDVNQHLSSRDPITLRIAGGGSFGGRGRSGVLWAGLSGDVPALAEVHADLRNALVAADLPHDARPFTPHLTVAYAQDRDVRAALDDYAGPAWTADAMVLVHSRHAEGGGYHHVRNWPMVR
jgi:hypothetical protein